MELTESNFNALVMESTDHWLVEFYAPWYVRTFEVMCCTYCTAHDFSLFLSWYLRNAVTFMISILLS